MIEELDFRFSYVQARLLKGSIRITIQSISPARRNSYEFRRKQPIPYSGGVSSWYVGESRLVGGQQAAVVSLQHMQLVVSVQQVQPLTNDMRAQPIVGGHIHSRLANIDILTFGSRRANNFKRLNNSALLKPYQQQCGHDQLLQP